MQFDPVDHGRRGSAELYLEEPSEITTIRDVLRPIEDGDSTIDVNLSVLPANRNRFNVDLLAGHPHFAIIEDRLSAAWQQLRARDTQGFRQTNWNNLLRNALHDRYDLAMYDLGPSLGSISQNNRYANTLYVLTLIVGSPLPRS